MSTSCHIAVFSKTPIPGAVKTRLIPALGADGAATLHHRLLRYTLGVVCRAGYPRSLWIAGELAHPALLDASDDFGIGLRSQQGADLGARMKCAMQRLLPHADAVLIVGTDCPVLKAEHFDQIFTALVNGCEVAAIPAEDGGYVLIGAARGALARREIVLDALFDDMPWSTDQVMTRTRERLRQIGASWHELPPLWDIDRPEDLVRLTTMPRPNVPIL
ncbi:TIGR04282 family arsenosugar biosynthesis glycosyltransferase [Burkholderia multivorans]|jgi:rSAM/selenodomain-associated transferase 1|uniref:TIGR04282 family arsenosugar biosynthesis glycosyltransferase n=1 Tax=Burkholderia TaxID=32008 RepID=UPI0005B3A3FA|nr:MULTISPECIES: TIGR04282 family arsenosugar biosynthesis glycosyltransferase [Burkholderia]HEP6427371.1 TIGR04282 family arsenosugar biosynthesis glycosyltransferase [Burkholderia cenocepacia]MBU9146455.1 TIGR04282 family arsenosugar biosynthesis glycosyltransferase [Burkholderia multivorans]MBU9439606.1 TIGR04282 family arsenosugar biosynthesis glycosyltransferase [Burkholderia multivorans]MBU9539787.1 TIGR04282 family arsenosugar biosynthesis glycosyltransferase [Burkholderia multivorans]M